jgi:hypothetical protein
MINFVNYTEFTLKNRKKEKKNENYIIILANINIKSKNIK